MIKTNSVGVSTISVNLNNSGAIDAQSGTIASSRTMTLFGSAITNLQISGGVVALDPSFQGGTITNLTLNAADLEGTNAVSGELMLTNCTVSGMLTVLSGGVFNWYGETLAQNASLTVAAGGVLNLESNPYSDFYLYGPLTNQGTVNWNGMNIQVQNDTACGGCQGGLTGRFGTNRAGSGICSAIVALIRSRAMATSSSTTPGP